MHELAALLGRQHAGKLKLDVHPIEHDVALVEHHGHRAPNLFMLFQP